MALQAPTLTPAPCLPASLATAVPWPGLLLRRAWRGLGEHFPGSLLPPDQLAFRLYAPTCPWHVCGRLISRSRRPPTAHRPRQREVLCGVRSAESTESILA